MLALIWWMYGGYAWLTNSISTRGLRQRAILLGGMAGYLVLALAVPGAFHGSGLAFGVGYLIVVAVHSSLFIWTASARRLAGLPRGSPVQPLQRAARGGRRRPRRHGAGVL